MARTSWPEGPDLSGSSGGWFGEEHHPEDATPADGVTFLNCGPAEAVRIGLAAAGGKNLGELIHLHRVGEGDPTSAVNVRYRPTTTAKLPTESVSGN